MTFPEGLEIARRWYGPGLWPLLAMIGVEFINLLTLRKLNAFGIVPREPAGLPGIVLAPLLHSDLRHFFANLPPFVLLCFVLGQLMPARFGWIFAAMVLGTGALVWLLGRKCVHVGASGVIYALFGFLTLHGYLSGNVLHLVVGVALTLLYSSLLWGALSLEARTSWESHLAGLAVGLSLAWWKVF